MAEQGKLTGKHVLLMVIAFFGVIIIANFFFISAAVNSFPGVTDDQAYQRGLEYNQQIAAREEQAALGWRAAVNEVTRKGENGIIVMRITNAAGQALSDLSIEGSLERPTNRKGDQPVVFNYAGGGLYKAEIVAFAPGAWVLTAQARNSRGDAFDIEARVIAP
ncbi:MAG: FixH family protein [Pseudomonadota bacterium]